MASEKLFNEVPSFPDDVPVASMSTISLASLKSGDEAGAKAILNASEELGFFLLDLRGDTLGEKMIKEIDKLFGAMKEILSLPDDVKEKYQFNIPKSFLGFKPRGLTKTETNEPDRYEYFNLGQDGLLGISQLQPVPDLVASYRDLFTSFLQHGQTIVSAICQSLAQQLSLPKSTFTALQPLDKPSGTIIRMIKAEASLEQAEMRTSMLHHSDFGTVTLLANVIGGLQILAPGKLATDKDAWLWVRPQPGHLVINLGDAMVQWTGGRLRSNVHRVYHAPGEQRRVERYSLGILVRPERDASMKSLLSNGGKEIENEDEKLTAWEWEVKKAMAMKSGDYTVRSTGGRTTVGVQS